MITNSRFLLSALAITLSTLTLVPSPSASAQIIAKANKNLYSETSDPAADIAAAMVRARR